MVPLSRENLLDPPLLTLFWKGSKRGPQTAFLALHPKGWNTIHLYPMKKKNQVARTKGIGARWSGQEVGLKKNGWDDLMWWTEFVGCRLWFVDLLYWFVDLVVEPTHLNKYAKVKLERVSPSRDENIRYLKPPPRRFYVVKRVCCWIYRVVDLAPNQTGNHYSDYR